MYKGKEGKSIIHRKSGNDASDSDEDFVVGSQGASSQSSTSAMGSTGAKAPKRPTRSLESSNITTNGHVSTSFILFFQTFIFMQVWIFFIICLVTWKYPRSDILTITCRVLALIGYSEFQTFYK